MVYPTGQKKLLLKENFKIYEETDEEWFERVYSDFRHRSMQQVIHQEDYADVPYWPYEWLVKVGTEYYFRYEGTMVVPPCWEVVHWRVMKDPIRVHPRQIAELNRLLAWRRSPSGSNKCEPDTAGILGPNNMTVSVNRYPAYLNPQHRFVFCECQNWPSKFQADQVWCNNYKADTNYNRFYKTPYSFNTNGQW